MTKITLLLAINFLILTSFAQEKKNNIEVSKDLISLIPIGKVTVEVLGDEIASPRKTELLTKFQLGISKNYEWFIEYLGKYPNGGMPYHENLGLTKEEYLELQKLQEHNELITNNIFIVEITKTDDIITFSTNSEKLKPLNSLTIELNANKVSLEKNKLDYLNATVITDERNAFQSKWRGYNWRFENPKVMNENTFKDRATITAGSYQVTIGRLEKNGKTFIILQGLEFIKGQLVANFELPIILNK